MSFLYNFQYVMLGWVLDPSIVMVQQSRWILSCKLKAHCSHVPRGRGEPDLFVGGLFIDDVGTTITWARKSHQSYI